MDLSEPDMIDLTIRLPRPLVESIVMRAASPADDPGARRLAFVRWIVASRRRRSKALKRIRLGEPTWDMILDLYAADREGRRVDISSLCLASGVPPTTALRYLDMLVAEGLVAKIDDAEDGRRAFVTMSGTLRAAMDDWLDQAEAGLNVSGWARPPRAPAGTGELAGRADV